MADVMDEEEDEGWKLGDFQILFVSMGQGDCCVVTCPDGAHIMIDCGSKALEAADAMVDVQELIRSTGVLAHPDSTRNQLAALILTHPDKDHITKVAEIVGGDTYYAGTDDPKSFDAIPTAKVYFSDYDTGRNDFQNSPLRRYGTSMCSSTLYDDAIVTELYCVTLRDGEQALDKWIKPFNATKHSNQNGLIANNRVTVRNGTILPSNITWEVSIIAGNVEREQGDQSDGDGRNAASLVTLIRLGTEKILVCGDATLSTENYLYATFKNANDIKTTSLLQAPHHGSSVTSSSANFVNLVKPKSVAISVQLKEHAHHLPGIAVLNAYGANADAADAHPSHAWERISDEDFRQAAEAWVNAKKNGTLDYIEESDNQFRVARFVRTGVDETFNDVLVLDGFTSQTKYVLRQTPLAKAIKQTGLDQHLFYYFP